MITLFYKKEHSSFMWTDMWTDSRTYRGRFATISGLIHRRPDTAAKDSRTSDTLQPLCTTMMPVNDTGYLDDLLDAPGVGE
jgi:hypothetical protein